MAALTISGLATDRVVFEGFLPRRSAPRRRRLEVLLTESRTMVFYEAVHRVAAPLEVLEELCGPDRSAAIARELTKIHERVYTGSLAELRSQLGDEIPLRGEFVLLVAGGDDACSASATEAQRIFAILNNELSAKAAVALTAEITGLRRNDIYRLPRVPD